MGFDRFPDDRPQSVVAQGFQKAYIYHAGGVERLVLQPSYTGVARDFGIFLATPEIPLIEKAEGALYGELERLIAPPPRAVSAKQIAPAAESADSWHGVSVIQQQLVGIYEATVLQASDRASFTDWLKKNGYVWPEELEPVFDHYVEAGWFFVAMKVNRAVHEETRFSGPIQPLSVRFTQDEILMPMKLTSLTPGGVDFMYYLITDTKIEATNVPKASLIAQKRLKETDYFNQSFPKLEAFLDRDVLLTRQDDLAATLSDAGLSEPEIQTVRAALGQRLWITKYQGHFNRSDLGADFVWKPAGKGRPAITDALEQVDAGARKKAVAAWKKGMRHITSVRLTADVFDTNEGYGKPTFVNGIHVGDLAAIGKEGSDRWQTVEMDLPHSVAHWLGDQVVVKIDNYGKEIPGKGRFADAYNLKNLKIVVEYDDGTRTVSKKFDGPVCSVPKWKNCKGTPVENWGDPVEVRF